MGADTGQAEGAARRRSRWPGPLAAAFLSFLLPGLGQAASGAWRRGLVLFAPIVLIAATAIAYAGRGLGYLVGSLLQPSVLLGLIVLNIALIGYRLLVMLDAYRLARRRQGITGRSRPAVAALLVLAGLVIGTHGALAYGSYAAYDLVTGVFADDQSGLVGGLEPDLDSPTPATFTPSATNSSEPSLASNSPAPTPTPTPATPPWAADGRFNVLLIGADSGPGRWRLRTDTLILVTVDVASARAALFGIPRNLVNVPLPPESAGAFACRCFPDLLNALYVYAGDHPSQFPGGDARGLRAVAGAVETLTATHLDGVVVANLNGFIALIDALGGVTINVAQRIVDNAYPKEDGSGDIRIVIEPGRQHMNGTQALRYARTRHQDSDYGRMERQQQVLVALRKQLNVCALLPRIPELVAIAKRTLTTDIRYRELPELIELAARVDSDRIARHAFIPPEIAQYLRASDIARIRRAVADAFKGPPPPREESPAGGPC